jgi:hypothetical protein
VSGVVVWRLVSGVWRVAPGVGENRRKLMKNLCLNPSKIIKNPSQIHDK